MKRLYSILILFFIALNLFSQSYNTLFKKGEKYYYSENYHEALKYFDRAIYLNSKNDFYFFMRGMTYFELNDYPNALRDIEIAIELDPDEGEYYFWRGRLKSIVKDYSGALNDFDKAIESDSYDDINYYWRCNAYYWLNDYGNAIADISKAINLDPQNDNYYFTRGRINAHNKNYDDAIDDFSKAIELNPDLIGSYTMLSIAYHRIGKNELGLKYAQMAYEKDTTGNPVFKSNLGLYYAYIGNFEKAINLIENAIQQDSTNFFISSMFFQLSRVFSLFGEKDKALYNLNLAFQKGFNDISYFEENYSDLALIHNDPSFRKLLNSYNINISPNIFHNDYSTSNYSKSEIINNTANGIEDVDFNIPTTNNQKITTYVLIIGNEDYSSYQTDLSSEANVDFAVNDATIFREYLIKTIGVPEKNITFKTNATLAQMKQALFKLTTIAEIKGEEAELIFYYSGHGLPTEDTHEAALIPVDVSGTDMSSAILLSDVYKQLTQYPTQKVTVFLDACFSGGARNQPLVAMRGVKVPPKQEMLSGNLVVFSSSTGEESSGAYYQKQHGMFTYFLLKKLQETKGDVTYKELSDYIYDNVREESVLVNEKLQTPQTLVSPDFSETWETFILK